MSNVQSVARAFTILQAVAARPQGVSITEIAHLVELPKSTVSRLVTTMERFAVVERLPDAEGVRLGDGIISMALHLPFRRSLTAVARPKMQELAAQLGEAIALCLQEGDQVYYVDQVPSRHHVQVRDWTGSRLPLHVVSPGKLFLSERDEAALERYLSAPLERYTPHTLVDRGTILNQLRRIRDDGDSWTVDEFEVGLTGMSAPIRDTAGRMVAAINVYGPGFRFPGDKGRDEIDRSVSAAANEITERIQQYL